MLLFFFPPPFTMGSHVSVDKYYFLEMRRPSRPKTTEELRKTVTEFLKDNWVLDEHTGHELTTTGMQHRITYEFTADTGEWVAHISLNEPLSS